MHILADTAHAGGALFFGMDPEERETRPASLPGVIVELSDEALKLLAAQEPDPGTIARDYTLDAMEERIAQVRQQIAAVWNSSLPDDEKERQISSLETEVSLLQAGQFTIVKNFHKVA